MTTTTTTPYAEQIARYMADPDLCAQLGERYNWVVVEARQDGIWRNTDAEADLGWYPVTLEQAQSVR